MSALLVASAGLAPAVQADEAELRGFTCGFASSNDPTGLVEQNPNVQTGTMTCGPAMSADLIQDESGLPTTDPGLVDLAITGTIQINQPEYGGAAAAKATCNASGTGVAFGACVISYEALPTDNVYLCTHTHEHRRRLFSTYTRTTWRCSLAISAGA